MNNNANTQRQLRDMSFDLRAREGRLNAIRWVWSQARWFVVCVWSESTRKRDNV